MTLLVKPNRWIWASIEDTPYIRRRDGGSMFFVSMHYELSPEHVYIVRPRTDNPPWLNEVDILGEFDEVAS